MGSPAAELGGFGEEFYSSWAAFSAPKAWDAIVLGRGARSDLAPAAAVAEAYTHERRGDEFLQPIIFSCK